MAGGDWMCVHACCIRLYKFMCWRFLWCARYT